MEANIDHLLNAQHCLAIAAAFIAIIAACATLITSANTKAESLANRLRKAAKEHRERSQDTSRCNQIKEQVCLFKERFRRVQRAQRLLFSTIALFISSLVIFISLGLYIIISNLGAESVHTIVHYPLIGIGICVALGTLCMLIAIYFQFAEVGASYETLRIETRDCPEPESMETANPLPAQVAESMPG